MGALLTVSAAGSIVLLALASFLGAGYLAGCAACLLWLSIARLVAADAVEKEGGAPGSAALAWSGALAVPGTTLVALSAAQAVLRVPAPSADPLALVSSALSVTLTSLVCARSLSACRGGASLSAWVGRRLDVASLATGLCAVVSQLLTLGDRAEWVTMTCLTGCVLGGGVLLVALEVALCALCRERGLMGCVRVLRDASREHRRAIHLTAAGKDCAMVVVKCALAALSASPFVLGSALFSCGVALARFTALRMAGAGEGRRLELFRRVGAVLAASGLAYALYSARFFFGARSSGGYGEVAGLAIATYTFVDFAVQTTDLVRLRRTHDLEARALRTVGLAAVLVNFPLTQAALMAFSESSDHAFSDGLSGVVFGGLVVVVGLVTLMRGAGPRGGVGLDEVGGEEGGDDQAPSETAEVAHRGAR